jgi:hypothetical protein
MNLNDFKFLRSNLPNFGLFGILIHSFVASMNTLLLKILLLLVSIIS